VASGRQKKSGRGHQEIFVSILFWLVQIRAARFFLLQYTKMGQPSGNPGPEEAIATTAVKASSKAVYTQKVIFHSGTFSSFCPIPFFVIYL
jgi:hypothetical protein